jgi:uncharacterized protein (DUF362 family)/Pyruvate/2-oxoacid:ferredoxin oxidoreductase delta subunit
MPDVSICRCKDYSEPEVKRAMWELLEQIDGLSPVMSGMKVVIKANLVTFLKPDKAATTHPALICELVRLLRERGAEVIIGDSPGGLYSKSYIDRVYAATDMKSAVLCGATLNNDFTTSEAEFPEAAAAKKFEYTTYLDNADMIINFCKLKSHGMMGMSAAVKNMFGAIPGTLKPEYHYRFPKPSDFANMLIDLNEYFKPSLNIVDAVVGMEGNGPTMGSPKYIGALLASRSPYKLDLACAHIIGLSADDVPTLRESTRRGLNPENVQELDLTCDIDNYAVSDFKTLTAQREIVFFNDSGSIKGKILGKVMNKAFRPYPGLGSIKCAGCGKCADICPAKAIAISKGKAIINRNECIRCFCCQEFCPVGAMVSKRSVIARMAAGRKQKRK